MLEAEEEGLGSIRKYTNWNRRPSNIVYGTLSKENTRSDLGRYGQEQVKIREGFLEELSFELAQRVKSIFPGVWEGLSVGQLIVQIGENV